VRSWFLLTVPLVLSLAGCMSTAGMLELAAPATDDVALYDTSGNGTALTGGLVKTYVLYGQGGAFFSPGIANLAGRLRAISPRLEVAVYTWSDHNAVVSDIRRQPEGTRFVIIGYSLGANATTWISNDVTVPIDLIVAYDPSVLSTVTPAGSNVRRAILYHNSSLEPFGHARIPGPTVETHETSMAHVAVQFSEQLHAITFDAVRRVLDSTPPRSDPECPTWEFVPDASPERCPALAPDSGGDVGQALGFSGPGVSPRR
jgi:hypothetical protein